MVKKSRWGPKFVDNRDWKIINEQGILKGEFLLDLDWIKDWKSEVDEMNMKKQGARFRFPDSLIQWQAGLSQWVDYRGLEGITKKLCDYSLLPEYNSYSTINRRVNKLSLEPKLPEEKNISASTDGSGIKMTNRGDYKETKYGYGNKKYAKVTITADPYTKKILAWDVCIEGEGDSESQVAMKHISALAEKGYKIKTFFGDGSFDTHDLFDKLDQYAIKSSIKIRKNASVDPDGTGSWRRKIEVLKYRKLGYKKWAKSVEYGRRWTGTEGIFSAVKRKFGENTRARNKENMFHEIKRKFWTYSRMCDYAQN